MACIPGGFRDDDRLTADDVEPSASVLSTLAEHAAITGRSGTVSAVGSGPTPMPTSEGVADDAVEDKAAFEDFVDEELWTLAIQAQVPPLSTIPQHLQNTYMECKGRHLLQTSPNLDSVDKDVALQAWWQILLLDKLVAHTGGDKSESLSSRLRQRMRSVEDGEWLQLGWELHSGAFEVSSRRPKEQRRRDVVKKVVRLAKNSSWRRALSAALRPESSQMDYETTKLKLEAELPKCNSLCAPCEDTLELDDDEVRKLRKLILAKIAGADDTAAGGVLASSSAFWKPLLKNPDYREATVDFFLRIALGKVPPAIKRVLIMGDLLAIPRPADDRVRPVVVPSFPRKVAMSAAQALFQDEVRRIVGPTQFAGVKDGVPKAYQAVRSLIKARPDHVVLSLDSSGAHVRIKRNALEQIVSVRCKPLGILRPSGMECPLPSYGGAVVGSKSSLLKLDLTKEIRSLRLCTALVKRSR